MGRKVLAVVVGWIAAGAVIMLGQMLMMLFNQTPITPGKNPTPDEFRDIIQGMPAQAFVFLAVIYAVASFAGGFIATKMGRRFSNGMRLALVVGILLEIGGLLNFFVFMPYHPMWAVVLCLAVYIPFALIGYRMARLPKDAYPHPVEA